LWIILPHLERLLVLKRNVRKIFFYLLLRVSFDHAWKLSFQPYPLKIYVKSSMVTHKNIVEDFHLPSFGLVLKEFEGCISLNSKGIRSLFKIRELAIQRFI
jgi:hypothetical protein